MFFRRKGLVPAPLTTRTREVFWGMVAAANFPCNGLTQLALAVSVEAGVAVGADTKQEAIRRRQACAIFVDSPTDRARGLRAHGTSHHE
jgi:hypothetical protein